ncbi:MAG: S-adenosylmethionine:tRNA ribosyltransferase-isomerase [Actinobacteria bacterium]|nr:S-adenosylmethionine:tRNA ribosyltransferase-isomerase [Actinomycetota bacterium]
MHATGEPVLRLRAGARIRLPPGGGLDAGAARSGTYLFRLPDGEREDVRVLVRYSADAPTVVFTGSLPDPERYQTVYARTPGSAAAPTAGLHFPEEVFAGLSRRGIGVARVDLHVSMDTFRPMTVDDVADHQMHRGYRFLSFGDAMYAERSPS